MVVGLIPPSCRIGGQKLDDEDPLRHWIAFQQIDLATARDDAPTEAGNCRQGTWHLSLISGRIGDADITDDVGGHGTFPAFTNNSAEPPVWPKPSRHRNPLDLKEGMKKRWEFWVNLGGEPSAGS